MNLKNLTEKQHEILKLQNGRHLVLAPPGSGKTDILGLRVPEAISTGVKPREMLCLTFTNRAAKNMNLRVHDLGEKKPFIGTLHKFGYRFLLINEIISYCTTLLDEEDANGFLSEAIEEAKEGEHKLVLKETNLKNAADYIRAKNQDKLRLKEQESPSEDGSLLELIAANYAKKKIESAAIDFDDVLHLTLHSLLYSNPKKMRDYKWVQLDEVQDLSNLQWRIVNELCQDGAHIVYFGDYDQAIYSFMGASHKDLELFTKDSNIHYLEDNFRSPKYLIDFFNAYATANMPNRQGHLMNYHRANFKTGGSVGLMHVSGSISDEASKIVAEIIPDLTRRLSNSAILTRTNSDADIFSAALDVAGIEHERVSGFDLFRRRIIKDTIAFLRAAANRDDRLAWARLLHIFGKIDTLRASRELVNEAFALGMRPGDWAVGSGIVNSLDEFSATLTNCRVIVFDTETTGLDTQFDDIIQIAAAEIVDGVATGNTFEVYLRSTKSLSDSSKIHGITVDILNEKGCKPSDGLRRFAEFVRGDVVVGHNVENFDMPMLLSNMRRHAVNWIHPTSIYDTLNLSRQQYPKLKNHKLATLIHELKLNGKNTHNALDDVLATVELVKRLAADSMQLYDARQNFLKSYRKFLSNFASNFTQAWKTTINSKNHSMHLSDFIERFLVYAHRVVGYDVTDNHKMHFNRLSKFFRLTLKPMPLGKILSEYVHELSTYSESDLIIGMEKLVVSTVHKAKGLEFDGIIITGCVEGVYPHFYATSEEAISEDARLLYVALSRAKNEIIVSTHDTVNTLSGRHSRYPSPFLEFTNAFPMVKRIK